MSAKPSYGIDAPDVIKTFLGIGGGLLLLALTGIRLAAPGGALFWLAVSAGVLALPLITLGTSMLAYAFFGKYRVRRRLLSGFAWRGDEAVLDVGTGRGFLAIGTAQRLTSGRVTGIDIWNAVDLSGNSQAAAERNASLEGVADKVTFRKADATALPFPDQAFDVAVSLLCIHNIDGEYARAQALAEIVRVLKPGGVLLLGDYVNTRAYAAVLRKLGMRVAGPANAMATAIGLMWIIRAQKPADIA